jgi:hypothetical protein
MKPEHEIVVDLIREVGVARLGHFDGCVCCHFNVRNIEIAISCGKGDERGLWISSPSLDYYLEGTKDDSDPKLLRPIAEEVRRQVEAADTRGPLPVHFHERRIKRK